MTGPISLFPFPGDFALLATGYIERAFLLGFGSKGRKVMRNAPCLIRYGIFAGTTHNSVHNLCFSANGRIALSFLRIVL